MAFAPSRRVIFTFDDCSTCLLPEIYFFQKGYYFIHTGSGVTGDGQVNDTIYHKDSEAAYRRTEMQLMLHRFTENPNQIPPQSRDHQMMQMFHNAWVEVYTKIDCVDAYKKTMMNVAFDDSEDHLASKKLMDLVSKEMLAFREELMKSQPVSTLKELKKQITLPEGVCRAKQNKNFDEPLPDESTDLYDGGGDDLDKDVVESNKPDEESNLDDPDQPTTETGEPVPAVPENLVTDSRVRKLIGAVLQKSDDMKRRCTSNSLIPCLAKTEGQSEGQAKSLRKEDKKVERILKKVILKMIVKNKTKQKETFLKCSSKHIVVLVIVIILFTFVLNPVSSCLVLKMHLSRGVLIVGKGGNLK